MFVDREDVMKSSLLIPTVDVSGGKRIRDDESPCVVCGRPVKLNGKQKTVWVHMGGSHVVTLEEGEHLNATGHQGADLGEQAVGNDCLRKHPELKTYVLT